ncbi:hypothetical protein O6H91_22G020200 [Diphasiastrum complanatum]|uniref:Uncharacterized protein n=1 Tax=Diphasiastrum complanatum TaxID=34168 RepID=A0ACC2ADH8_DIPCM|nr:hypothetical protein O6H91_22G020200 [Diphasiastrum complanatum]
MEGCVGLVGSAHNELPSGVLDVPLPLDKLSSQCGSQNCSRLNEQGTKIVVVSTGSFNPPTYMHLRMFELAKDALLSEGYDFLGGYMSPVNDSYGKQNLVLAEHRIEMCKVASSTSSFIMVDPWEARQPTYQRTLYVLDRVQDALNNTFTSEKVKVMLLCGADLLESFITPGVWIPEQVQAIFEIYGVICICRGGQDTRNVIFENDLLYNNKKNIKVVDEQIANDISSTKVRRNLERGLSVKYLIPDEVIKYIKEHYLYTHIKECTNTKFG